MTKDKKRKRVFDDVVSENDYFNEIWQLKQTIPDWNNLFDSSIDEQSRLQQWIRLRVLGQPLVEKFAWAIPDNRSLRIIAEFSPIVEIGAGKGYWAR